MNSMHFKSSFIDYLYKISSKSENVSLSNYDKENQIGNVAEKTIKFSL